jgi:hypothetical protein
MDLATNLTLFRTNRTLQVNKERGRKEPQTDEELESKPSDKVGVHAQAHTGREEGDSLLTLPIDAVRHPDDTGDDSDEECRSAGHD